MQSISASELKNVFNPSDPAVALIDVREPSEFQSGHIEGAQNIPLGSIAKAAYELRDFTTVYVYCRSGGRSALACQMLASVGVNVINVDGGMLALSAT